MDHATALTSRRLAFVFFCQPIAVEEIRPLPRQTNRVIKKKKSHRCSSNDNRVMMEMSGLNKNNLYSLIYSTNI